MNSCLIKQEKFFNYESFGQAVVQGKWISKVLGKAFEIFDIGKGIHQGIETVKDVYKDVKNAGKSIGKALSSVKLPEIKLGW